MKIETYTFEFIDAKMHIVIEGDEALAVDPCISQEAFDSLDAQGIRKVNILLTHEHYDHMSGIGAFREKYPDCKVICSENCDKYLQSPLRNGSKYFKALVMGQDEEVIRRAEKVQPVAYEADDLFTGERNMQWQGHRLVLTETPGHSPGSICILLDEEYLFTGDSLLRDDPVITRLPGGNKKQYEEITEPYLKNMAARYPQLLVVPGHGENFLLRERI